MLTPSDRSEAATSSSDKPLASLAFLILVWSKLDRLLPRFFGWIFGRDLFFKVLSRKILEFSETQFRQTVSALEILEYFVDFDFIYIY